jgi:fructokinase
MTIGAIEAGGTKFVCGLYEAGCSDSAKPVLVAKESFPTTSPEETLRLSRDFFARSEASGLGKIDALGIGCFGPVELHPTSPSWGHITSTPKPLWRDAEVAGYFRKAMGVPVAFDTDVNAAAYGEFLWGAAKGLKDFVYMTIGTGIGGGVFSNGSIVHGLTHPELGHIKLQREAGDSFAGVCPYHRDCFEGMASGPAIGARWKTKPEELGPGHEAWELEASYLAKAFAAYSFVLSPERVIMGGGVGMRPGLAERVAALLREELGGYVPALDGEEALSKFVVRPLLGAEAGLYGSAALALRNCCA